MLRPHQITVGSIYLLRLPLAWALGVLTLAIAMANSMFMLGLLRFLAGVGLGGAVGSIYLLRLPLAWALGVWMGYGLAGIWWGLSIEMAVRGLLFLARFHYGNWQKLRV